MLSNRILEVQSRRRQIKPPIRNANQCQRSTSIQQINAMLNSWQHTGLVLC
jgi:hypothetical protein